MLTEGVVEPCMENERRTSEFLTTNVEPRPLGMSSGPEPSERELQTLWAQQHLREAQNMVLQKKLSHYRNWINTLQNKVQQQNPHGFKNAKRLYVGGFSSGTSEENLRSFLGELLIKTGGCSVPGNPIVSVRIVKDKNFAFAEFRTVEETVNATALDGVIYDTSRLKIRRPSNYDINAAILLGPLTPDPTMNVSGLDVCRSTVEDSPHKLFIGGLPYEYSEERVREMVESYASVRSFNLVMDRATGKSKGFAFCELVDESNTDFVIQQLNSQKVENKLLTVKRAMEGGKNANAPLLHSMMTSVLQNGGNSSCNGGGGGGNGAISPFPSSEISSHGSTALFPSYGLMMNGAADSNQGMMMTTSATTTAAAAVQRPYSVLGLTGINTGNTESLIGRTSQSNASIQPNCMLNHLASHGQRPSSMISQISSITNGSNEALPHSYGSFSGGGIGDSSVGAMSTFGSDIRMDPDFLGHDFSQSLRSTCLQNNKMITTSSSSSIEQQQQQQQGLHASENQGGNHVW